MKINPKGIRIINPLDSVLGAV